MRTGRREALLLLLTCVAAPAAQELAAQDPTREGSQAPLRLSSEEPVLMYKVGPAEAQMRSLLVRVHGEGPADLGASLTSDLVDADTGVVVLRDLLRVDIDDPVEGRSERRLAVTFLGTAHAGLFIATLRIRDLAAPDSAPLLVGIDVLVAEQPWLEPTAESASIALEAVLPFADLPGFGTPAAVSAARDADLPLAETSVILTSRNEASATIDQATVLGLRDGAGRELPAGVVRITDAMPRDVLGGQAVELRLVVAGRDLAAGEYRGVLRIDVAENPLRPIEIPVVARVKHGPLAALAVLVAGLLVGFLLNWWSGARRERRQLLRDIARLCDDVDKVFPLPDRERRRVLQSLRSAIDAGQGASQLRAEHDGAHRDLRRARDEVDDLLDRVAGIETEVDAVRHFTELKRMLRGELDGIRTRLERGDYRCFDDARAQLGPDGRIPFQVEELRELAAEVRAMSRSRRDALVPRLDAASSMLSARRAALGDSGAGRRHAAAVETVPHARGVRFALHTRRAWPGLPALLVPLALYGFTLAVGWVALYSAAPSFGQDPIGYVTLFLWGAVGETLRGRVVEVPALRLSLEECPVAPNEAPS